MKNNYNIKLTKKAEKFIKKQDKVTPTGRGVISLSPRANSKIVENIVIDTGAAGSIISPDAVEDIGICAELG